MHGIFSTSFLGQEVFGAASLHFENVSRIAAVRQLWVVR
jgi:hypothetical protein